MAVEERTALFTRESNPGWIDRSRDAAARNLNDDYTPMDFVIGVLCTFFHKNFDDANRIMWQVHNNGVGECGVYTYEVADTKVTQVMDHARKHQHPLQCVMEKK
jgi:ATP-dependent Clp protease adaptor protein ClpS